MDPSMVKLVLDEMKKLGNRIDACFDRLEHSFGLRHSAPEDSVEVISEGKPATATLARASSNSITIPCPPLLPAVDTDAADPYELTGAENDDDVVVAPLLPPPLHYVVEGNTNVVTFAKASLVLLAEPTSNIDAGCTAEGVVAASDRVGLGLDGVTCNFFGATVSLVLLGVPDNVGARDHFFTAATGDAINLFTYSAISTSIYYGSRGGNCIGPSGVRPIYVVQRPGEELNHITSNVFTNCVHARCSRKCTAMLQAPAPLHMSTLIGIDHGIPRAGELVFEVFSLNPSTTLITVDEFRKTPWPPPVPRCLLLVVSKEDGKCTDSLVAARIIAQQIYGDFRMTATHADEARSIKIKSAGILLYYEMIDDSLQFYKDATSRVGSSIAILSIVSIPPEKDYGAIHYLLNIPHQEFSFQSSFTAAKDYIDATAERFLLLPLLVDLWGYVCIPSGVILGADLLVMLHMPNIRPAAEVVAPQASYERHLELIDTHQQEIYLPIAAHIDCEKTGYMLSAGINILHEVFPVINYTILEPIYLLEANVITLQKNWHYMVAVPIGSFFVLPTPTYLQLPWDPGDVVSSRQELEVLDCIMEAVQWPQLIDFSAAPGIGYNLKMFNICSTSKEEVAKAIMGNVQSWSKAFLEHNNAVLVQREELLNGIYVVDILWGNVRMFQDAFTTGRRVCYCNLLDDIIFSNVVIFGNQRSSSLQYEVCGTAIDTRDCSVLMPTSGGNSLCSQLPATEVIIVVCPLLSLLHDHTVILLASLQHRLGDKPSFKKGGMSGCGLTA